jgi:hypothetical protein
MDTSISKGFLGIKIEIRAEMQLNMGKGRKKRVKYRKFKLP